MALIALPASAEFVRNVWRPLRTVQVNRSAYTRARQAIHIGGDSWSVAAMIVPASTEAEVREWRAFIALLQNERNTFNMPAAIDQHSGAEATAPAAQGGVTTLILSAAVPVVPGCYATIPLAGGKKQLVLLTAVNGATISFDRQLRDATESGAVVATKNPYGEVALTSPPAPDDADGSFSWEFEAEEAF